MSCLTVCWEHKQLQFTVLAEGASTAPPPILPACSSGSSRDLDSLRDGTSKTRQGRGWLAALAAGVWHQCQSHGRHTCSERWDFGVLSQLQSSHHSQSEPSAAARACSWGRHPPARGRALPSAVAAAWGLAGKWGCLSLTQTATAAVKQ